MSPELSTLPQRMREAADVIDEAAAEFHGRPENMNSGWLAHNWTAKDLRTYADDWEAADRQAEALTDELARDLYGAGWRKVCRSDVRQLIESGWTKS
jgi:hypothetical protein